MARGVNKVIHRYLEGLSIPEISKELSMPLSTIRFRLKKAGVLRSRAEGVRNAAKKNLLGSGNRGKKRFFDQQWKDNIGKAKSGIGKGYSVKPNGYIEITMGENKGKTQHKVVMEDHIGRELSKDECVHHIDRDRQNNNLVNLQLMTKSDHSRLHALEDKKNQKRNTQGRFS